ncbi:hypothetical protein SAMN04489761_0099 [Tenacibaculum sp. MAR_2009_124]|uniref:hypothetical protein n=1 Tax=Tenacibaculum sp. MAR_2009_124 TaxID=1250059 RepID=UPI0008973860|nr:hypothetical protein [Tenacibaculum sp. MAR_2009_124]SEB35860.1 hypothetical protein SAMN04489761_0099 [Tenacibaculum sp. MAR_2009_124]
MIKKQLIITAFLFAGIQSFAQWSKGKGKGYFKLSAWYLQSDQHFTNTGELDPNVTRTQFNTNLYGEYGLSNKLDVIAYIPFFARVAQNNQLSGTNNNTIQSGESFNSFGDIDFGVRYAIFKKGNWALDAKLLLGLPTGSSLGGSDGSYQTGDGEFNQYLSTSIGYSTRLFKRPAYLKSYLGYNNRTKGFSDELRVGFEVGVNVIVNKLWLSSRVNILQSLQNGTLNAANSNGSIFANNVEFSSYGFEAAYYITNKIGASVSFDSAFSGRIIAANPSYSVGIFYDLK